MEAVRRILIDGLDNTRDLGGFVTENGFVARYNVFYRSESLFGLNEKAVKKLIEMGITNCIDVHGPIGDGNDVHPFQARNGCKYFCFPVLSDVIKHTGTEKDSFSDKDWIYVNTRMLEKDKAWVGLVISACADTVGGTIIHCRTGKSRTSLICMLLMLLAKIPAEDIIAEFASTEIYMGRKYRALLKTSCHSPGFYKSPAFIMERTMEYLLKQYGSVEKYLSLCGVSAESMERIKIKFVADHPW